MILLLNYFTLKCFASILCISNVLYSCVIFLSHMNDLKLPIDVTPNLGAAGLIDVYI